MEYLIKRGDAQFGPYSLAGLQQYLQSGQLSSDDLTRSEGMAEWVPLSQVLGTVPVPPPPVPGNYGATQIVEPQAHFVDMPPNMPWWVLLILVAITRQFFGMIWAIVLGNWARKLSGKNNALVLVAMYPAAIISGVILAGLGSHGDNSAMSAGGGLLIIAGAIIYLVGIYTIRSDMEQYYNSVEKLGLSLSGVMVFFFGVIYLQYHVNSLSKLKKMASGY